MGNKSGRSNSFASAMAASQVDTFKHISHLVNFSFKYLADNNTKFNYKGYQSSYFLEFLGRLKSVSLMKMSDLMANRSASLRCHPIKWDDTSEESFGIPNEEQLVSKPYQFSLSANEYGRIHGFIIDTQFYVVWLDRDHNLYPGK